MVMQINLVVVVVDFWSGEQKPDLQPETRIALTAWSLLKKKTKTKTKPKKQQQQQQQQLNNSLQTTTLKLMSC